MKAPCTHSTCAMATPATSARTVTPPSPHREHVQNSLLLHLGGERKGTEAVRRSRADERLPAESRQGYGHKVGPLRDSEAARGEGEVSSEEEGEALNFALFTAAT